MAALRTTKFKDENVLYSSHRVSCCAITALEFYNRDRVYLLRGANWNWNIIQVNISLYELFVVFLKVILPSQMTSQISDCLPVTGHSCRRLRPSLPLIGRDCLLMRCIILLNLNDVVFISSAAYRLTRIQYMKTAGTWCNGRSSNLNRILKTLPTIYSLVNVKIKPQTRRKMPKGCENIKLFSLCWLNLHSAIMIMITRLQLKQETRD